MLGGKIHATWDKPFFGSLAINDPIRTFFQEKSKRHSERLKESEALLGAKEKQLRNLLEAFKRQMELIHVLRQQKVFIVITNPTMLILLSLTQFLLLAAKPCRSMDDD